jgi:glycosyltransferase involved in cell wall biosynthesis
VRIALVHSRYGNAVPSGENAVVDAEYAALREAGVDVALFQTDPDTVRSGSGYPVWAALRVASGRGPEFGTEIREFAPDVVHVHNAFPDLGERDLARIGAPLVLTAHNYRSFCANGYAFRDGGTCLDCVSRPGGSWNAVAHGCYRGRLASVPLAIRNHRGPGSNPLVRAASTVLIPSEQSRQILVQAGLPAGKAVLSPHFLPRALASSAVRRAGRREPYAFVGRLTPEKGLEPILSRWPVDRELVVVGDGEDRQRLSAKYGSERVRFIGRIPRQEVVEVLSGARALIFSSLWWETFGLVAMEALSAGTPVLSVGEHAVADLVREHRVGHAVGHASEIAQGLAAIEAVDEADWQAAVTSVFAERYSEDVWLRRRLDEYAMALGGVQDHH